MQRHVNTCLDSDSPKTTPLPGPSKPAPKSPKRKTSAFTNMMLREKENAAWKAAELDDAPASVRKAAAAKAKAKAKPDDDEADGKKSRRKAPFYKVTTFSICERLCD